MTEAVAADHVTEMTAIAAVAIVAAGRGTDEAEADRRAATAGANAHRTHAGHSLLKKLRKKKHARIIMKKDTVLL